LLVSQSIVKIERHTTYYAGSATGHMVNYGTGVIVGVERVNHHQEYLLLSNEHVAKNHHITGKRLSTLSIVAGNGVREPILLETVAIDPRRDVALLRTVNCPGNLKLPDWVLGSPPEGIRRAIAFTEGYGNGVFSTLEGEIVSTKAVDWSLKCVRIDVPVAGGQSGAPLVVIGADRRLYLVALVFCGTEHYTDATPLFPGQGVLRQLTSLVDRHIAGY